MVSEMMGGLVDGATEEFDDAVGEDLTKADQLLEGIAGAFHDDGTPREIDVDAVEAFASDFVREVIAWYAETEARLQTT